MRKAPA